MDFGILQRNWKPWLRQLVTSLPLQRPGSIHVVDKMHWDRFFSEFFGFPINIIPPWLSILLYHKGKNNRPICGCTSEM
jgi:hypothetical protein